MSIAVTQADRKSRRREGASQINGLALAGGQSSEDWTCFDRSSCGKGKAVIGREDLPGAPWSGKRRVHRHAAAAQEEHADQGVGAMEAEGPIDDHSQLVVEALDDTVGEPGFDVGENIVLVLSNGLGGRDERFEPGARGPGEPSIQFPLGVVEGGLFEDGGEGLLEQVGAVEGGVVLLDRGELIPLLGAEVPGVLEQGVPGLLDRGGFFGSVKLFEVVDLISADLIDSIGSESEDVEEVEDDLSPRHLGLYGLDEGGGHIDGDDLNHSRPFLSELIEESVKCLGVLTLGGPDDAMLVVIDDGGDVAMALAKADLVDADTLETVEPPWVESFGDDALDDVAHGAPGDAHHPGDLCLVGDLGEVGGHLFEGSGETAAGPCPGNQLYTDAAVRTLHAPWCVFEDEPDRADTEVNPADWITTAVVAGADLPAAGTARPAPGRLHREDDTDLLKIYSGDEKTGDSDQDSGKLGDAHGFFPAFGRFCEHQKARKTVRFQFIGAVMKEIQAGNGSGCGEVTSATHSQCRRADRALLHA